MMFWDGGLGWVGWLGPLWMLLFWGFWVGLTAAVVLGVARLFNRPEAPLRTEDSAVRLLRERYARGDISQEELEAGLKILGR